MRAVGIATPMLFAIGKSGPDTPIQPPADALTPLWWELVEHAAAECGRLGLTLALNDCDGWATASGPWITPELSMQCLVWSGTTVERRGAGAKPRADNRPRSSATIATSPLIALPWPEQWDRTSYTEQARVTTSLPLKVSDAARIGDPDNTGAGHRLGGGAERPAILDRVRVRAAVYAPLDHRAHAVASRLRAWCL